MKDEAGLLEAARRKDPDAIGQIFDLYANALFKYAVRLCHDTAKADQIIGDVFAKLLEHLSAGKGPRTNLRSYLYQITYHEVVEHSRDAAHVSSMDEAMAMPDGTMSVAGQVEEQELLRELEAAVAYGLTEEQRHVIMLRYVEGFSLQETAEITGKKVNAISVLQNRAIAKLRQHMNKKFGATI
jgi:RNA polymerase sigma-70 factor, ECF subfamily